MRPVLRPPRPDMRIRFCVRMATVDVLEVMGWKILPVPPTSNAELNLGEGAGTLFKSSVLLRSSQRPSPKFPFSP